jgi:Flp pilus assembly protein TadG
MMEVCVKIAMPHSTRDRRRAAAIVELAICLPVLMFLFLITVDWARVYYYDLTLLNCARQGALYASDPLAAAQSPYASLLQAALADATNLNPQPTVTSAATTDGSGNPAVAVTVAWQFSTVVPNYPGVTNPMNLSRTVTMRLAQ